MKKSFVVRVTDSVAESDHIWRVTHLVLDTTDLEHMPLDCFRKQLCLMLGEVTSRQVYREQRYFASLGSMNQSSSLVGMCSTSLGSISLNLDVISCTWP